MRAYIGLTKVACEVYIGQSLPKQYGTASIGGLTCRVHGWNVSRYAHNRYAAPAVVRRTLCHGPVPAPSARNFECFVSQILQHHFGLE